LVQLDVSTCSQFLRRLSGINIEALHTWLYDYFETISLFFSDLQLEGVEKIWIGKLLLLSREKKVVENKETGVFDGEGDDSVVDEEDGDGGVTPRGELDLIESVLVPGSRQSREGLRWKNPEKTLEAEVFDGEGKDSDVDEDDGDDGDNDATRGESYLIDPVVPVSRQGSSEGLRRKNSENHFNIGPSLWTGFVETSTFCFGVTLGGRGFRESSIIWSGIEALRGSDGVRVGES